jgi:hypothetical protein
MGLRWNGKAAVAKVRRVAAEYVFDAALLAQQELMDALDVPYPPASRPGEFPRRRTGNLRMSVEVFPKSVRQVMRTGSVTIRYGAKGFYGNILVEKLGRKGPADVVARALARKLSVVKDAGKL